VYSSATCRRAYRLAKKGRGYAFADNSGYASYVTIAARKRVVVQRRVRVKQRTRVVKRRVVRQRVVRQRVVRQRVVRQRVVRQPQIIYVDEAPRVIVRRRGSGRRIIIQGGMDNGGYGYGSGGVAVHYGPLITKQAPY
ncbi:hypothetical protein MNBD_ALPHA08-2101, partial [hydrothermal vent metagenome]